jgi:hypothetical protein
MSDEQYKGENPFDRFVSVRRTVVAPPLNPPPPPKEVEGEEKPDRPDLVHEQTDDSGPAWQRIQEARELAAYQQRRLKQVEEALSTKTLPPQPLVESTSKEFEVIHSLSTEDVRTLKGGSWIYKITGREVWYSLWAIIWLAGTAAAMHESLLGGLALSFLWFWPCVFLAKAPSIYSGLFEGGRAGNGSAV